MKDVSLVTHYLAYPVIFCEGGRYNMDFPLLSFVSIGDARGHE